MASNANVEQRVVIKFLVNEGVKPGEIYSRLLAQYGDETLSCSKKFEWCKPVSYTHLRDGFTRSVTTEQNFR